MPLMALSECPTIRPEPTPPRSPYLESTNESIRRAFQAACKVEAIFGGHERVARLLIEHHIPHPPEHKIGHTAQPCCPPPALERRRRSLARKLHLDDLEDGVLETDLPFGRAHEINPGL